MQKFLASPRENWDLCFLAFEPPLLGLLRKGDCLSWGWGLIATPLMVLPVYRDGVTVQVLWLNCRPYGVSAKTGDKYLLYNSVSQTFWERNFHLFCWIKCRLILNQHNVRNVIYSRLKRFERFKWTIHFYWKGWCGRIRVHKMAFHFTKNNNPRIAFW